MNPGDFLTPDGGGPPAVVPAAIPFAGPAGAEALNLFFLPFAALDVPPQARKVFDEDFIDRLAAVVLAKGQTWPVKVRRGRVPERWELVAGEQRLRACLKAGQQGVWAIEATGDPTEADTLEEQLQENGLRTPLRPCEEAEALEKLRQLRGCTCTDLAKALRFHLTHVSRRLSLLKYPPALRGRIDAGEVAETVAVEIAKVSKEQDRLALFERAARERWTQEKARAATAALAHRRKARAAGANPLKRLCLQLGPHGATVAIGCPEHARELTTEEVQYALEFALKKVRKAIRKKLAAADLPRFFKELAAPRPSRPAEGVPCET